MYHVQRMRCWKSTPVSSERLDCFVECRVLTIRSQTFEPNFGSFDPFGGRSARSPLVSYAYVVMFSRIEYMKCVFFSLNICLYCSTSKSLIYFLQMGKVCLINAWFGICTCVRHFSPQSPGESFLINSVAAFSYLWATTAAKQLGLRTHLIRTSKENVHLAQDTTSLCPA